MGRWMAGKGTALGFLIENGQTWNGVIATGAYLMDPFRFLTWDQVKELARSRGWVEGSYVDPRRPVSKKDRAAVYERDGHKCLKCGRTERLTVDHVIPVTDGGTNGPENLQTLCLSCNTRKSDRARVDYRQNKAAA